LTNNWRGIQAPSKLAIKSRPISRQSPLKWLDDPAEVLVDNKARALLKNKAGMVWEASPLCAVLGASSCAENR
jgi:hypothetical protein